MPEPYIDPGDLCEYMRQACEDGTLRLVYEGKPGRYELSRKMISAKDGCVYITLPKEFYPPMYPEQ